MTICPLCNEEIDKTKPYNTIVLNIETYDNHEISIGDSTEIIATHVKCMPKDVDKLIIDAITEGI